MRSFKSVIFSAILSLFASTSANSESKGTWELWVVPNKYTINQGERVELAFGLTGYGNIDQSKLKIIAHSEGDTLIQHGEEKAMFDTYAITPNKTSPDDRFTKTDDRAKGTIITVSDYNSDFGKLFLTPKSTGNKKLTLNATYFIPDDGWHSSNYDFEYHVNTWAEEHQTVITIISILSAILAIGFLPTFGSWCLGTLKNKLNKNRCPK